MDDTRRPNPFVGALACAACFSLAGCSLFVMAGKMFFGNPKLPCAFHTQTNVDLTRGKERLLIVVSTPETIKADLPSLSYDLAEGVTRRLKLRGVDVIDPDEVADWMDDNGGRWGHPRELAERFDADYIAHIDLNRFDYREEHSAGLFRGRSHGVVSVYRVEVEQGRPRTASVFEHEFDSVFPEHMPVAVDQMSPRVFRKRYLDRVSTKLAQLFHDYRSSEMVE